MIDIKHMTSAASDIYAKQIVPDVCPSLLRQYSDFLTSKVDGQEVYSSTEYAYARINNGTRCIISRYRDANGSSRTWPNSKHAIVIITTSTHLWKDAQSAYQLTHREQISTQINNYLSVREYSDESTVVLHTITGVYMCDMVSVADTGYVCVNDIILTDVETPQLADSVIAVKHTTIKQNDGIAITVNDPNNRYGTLFINAGGVMTPYHVDRDSKIPSGVYTSVTVNGVQTKLTCDPLTDESLVKHGLSLTDVEEVADDLQKRLTADRAMAHKNEAHAHNMATFEAKHHSATLEEERKIRTAKFIKEMEEQDSIRQLELSKHLAVLDTLKAERDVVLKINSAHNDDTRKATMFELEHSLKMSSAKLAKKQKKRDAKLQEESRKHDRQMAKLNKRMKRSQNKHDKYLSKDTALSAKRSADSKNTLESLKLVGATVGIVAVLYKAYAYLDK